MDLIDGIPERSASGRLALDVFYCDSYTGFIYVEDDDQENLYYEIFCRFSKEFRDYKIIPLGGKSAVIEHITMDKPNYLEEKLCLYIADKDFDDLLDGKREFDNLYYWKYYCVENYLYDEDALVNLIIETYPKQKKEEILSKLRLESFWTANREILKRLFAAFYIVQKEKLGIENTGLKPELFTHEKKRWKVSEQKVFEYVAKVKKIHSYEDVCDVRLVEFNDCDFNKIVCGKHVMKLLFHYVNSKYPLGSISFDSFVFRIAKNSSLQKFRSEVEVIKEYFSMTKKMA